MRKNKALQVFIPRFSQISLFLIAFLLSTSTFANPSGGNVSAGSATITHTPGVTTINQTSRQAIINWQSFNIKKGEATHFYQPNGGIALNRINPSMGASQIYGVLTATGRIILINSAGIFFGPSAYVNVGGIIASTANISDKDFINGNYRFVQDPRYVGTITNQGTIIAADHGLVALLGSSVDNSGRIQANMGTIALGAGSGFTLQFAGNDLVNFIVDEKSASRNGVRNTGGLVANGGTVMVSAATARGILDNAINMQGYVETRSVTKTANGRIFLSGDPNGGTVNVAANINASGRKPGQSGGSVSITGYNIVIDPKTTIDVSGDINGGSILIGRDAKGLLAKSTTIMPGVHLNASAVNGNGGLIETSGEYLAASGIDINTSAPNGSAGTWLIDPRNILIQAAGSTTATSTSTGYLGDVDTSIITVADLQNALANSNVLIQTGLSGVQAGDITVASDVTWSNSNTLRLSAYRNININANITNLNGGSLSLIADNTGTGTGTVLFSGGGPQISLAGGGAAKLYYNPTVFGTATNFAGNAFLGGGSTLTAYMLVNNTTNLQNINGNLSGNYALGKDINLNGTLLNPIGTDTTPFSGLFDGQGYIVSNFVINQSGVSNVGLFGATASTAQIANLGVSGTVIGNDNVGVLVGSNAGSISNVFSAGFLAGASNAGGLIGFNSGDIENAYSLAAVSASGSAAGALVGQNSASGMIQKTFAAGATTGAANVGGLVGINSGVIQNSFWDTDMTGRNTAVGSGAGLSVNLLGGCFTGTCLNGGTVNLSAASTYNNAGWDMINAWGVVSGQSYAYLKSIYPTAPRILSGQIAEFTSYYNNPAWAPMPETEKNPIWSSLTPTTLSKQQVTLVANGEIIDKTYSGANGGYYFVERQTVVPDGAAVLAYLSGGSKGNVITEAPVGGLSINNLSIALNTVLLADNGLYPYSWQLSSPVWQLKNYTLLSSDTFSNAIGSLSNDDILYTHGPLADINVKPNVNFVTAPNTALALRGNITTTHGSITTNGLTVLSLSDPSYQSTYKVKTIGGGNIQNIGNVVGQSATPAVLKYYVDSANNIIFVGSVDPFNAIVNASGDLIVSAATTPQSITTSDNNYISVGNFKLLQGMWYQNFPVGLRQVTSFADTFPIFALGPAMTVFGNFEINSGIMPSTTAEFIRVTGGNGTIGSPYLVSDNLGLQGIGSSPYTLQASWALLNHTNAPSTVGGTPTIYSALFNTGQASLTGFRLYETFLWNGGKGFVPIGTMEHPFSGTFDGHTDDGSSYGIWDLAINRPTQSNVGLFGVTSPTAYISNVWVTQMGITGKDNVGAIVGYNQGTIINSGAQVSFIVGNKNVGAISGLNTGTITGAGAFQNRVLGNQAVGGIAGNNGGTIDKSFAAYYIGLLPNGVGPIGGIAGINSGTISRSFWDTDVTGRRFASGANTGSISQTYGGCLTGGCTNGGTVVLSNINTYLNAGWDITNDWDFSTTWNPNSSTVWGIMPASATQYSYPYPLSLYASSGGLPRILAGRLSPGAANQLIIENWGVNSIEGDRYHFPLLRWSTTGADGSFYLMTPSYDNALKTLLYRNSVLENEFVMLVLRGDKAQGTVLFKAPATTSTYSGSLMNVPLSVKLGPTGTGSDNMAFNEFIINGLFIGLPYAEVLAKIASLSETNYYANFHIFTDSTVVQQGELYNKAKQLYIDQLYLSYVNAANYFDPKSETYGNTYFFEIAGNINDLLKQIENNDKNILTRYAITPLLPTNCK